MIVVVADTSPVNYFVQFGEIDLLPKLFDQVVIPRAVHRELQDPSTSLPVRNWASQLPRWAIAREASKIEPLSLDPGETEAIVLAKELGAFAIILDDGPARLAARVKGLRITGTIGILERTAAESWIILPDVIEKLRATTFHASRALLDAALARDAARRNSNP